MLEKVISSQSGTHLMSDIQSKQIHDFKRKQDIEQKHHAEYVAYSLRGCSQPSFPLRKAVQKSTLVVGHSRTSSKLTLESWHSQRLEHRMMLESCSASEYATYSLRLQSMPTRRRKESRVESRFVGKSRWPVVANGF